MRLCRADQVLLLPVRSTSGSIPGSIPKPRTTSRCQSRGSSKARAAVASGGDRRHSSLCISARRPRPARSCRLAAGRRFAHCPRDSSGGGVGNGRGDDRTRALSRRLGVCCREGHRRRRHAGGAIARALLWIAAGFLAGALFWYAVGFWRFRRRQLSSLRHQLRRRKSTAVAPPRQVSLPSIYLVDPANCSALHLNRETNSTELRPCPRSGLALAARPRKRARGSGRYPLNDPAIVRGDVTARG